MKNSSVPSPPPSLTSLPEEIVVNCLARIPRSHYPKLSLVSKTFRSLLSSTELYAARSRLGSTEKCLYICLPDWNSGQRRIWYTLRINSKQDVIKKKKKAIRFRQLVPISYSHFPPLSIPIVVGSEIYTFSGDSKQSSKVRVLDCRSHTWRDAPSMNVARMNAYACVYDGKIYVMGGVKDDESSYAEVFDIKTQSWKCLPDPGIEIRKCFIYRIAEVEGKIIFGYSDKMYAYDTKQGKWECGDGLVTTMATTSGIVVENVSYFFTFNFNSGRYGCNWYDIKDGVLKEVRGLDALEEKFKMNGGGSMLLIQIVSFGEKLLTIWQESIKKRNLRFWTNTNHFHKKKKIWCMEISLEKRQGGEVWGNVEWFDVVHTVPRSCPLSYCLAVSV